MPKQGAALIDSPENVLNAKEGIAPPAVNEPLADRIDARKVTCWRQRIGSSWSFEYRVLPELLERFASLDVPAGTTQEFWLTIHVPADARPGEYRAPIRVTTADGGAWQTELTLRVLPFTLRRSPRVVGMYWRDEKPDAELLDTEARDMLAHGMSAVTLSRKPQITNVDGKAVVDCTELVSFLLHLKQLGMTGPIPYYPHLQGLVKRAFPDGDFDTLFVDVVRQIHEACTAAGTLQLLYYPVDESGGSDERGQEAAHLCELIAKVPGAVSYIDYHRLRRLTYPVLGSVTVLMILTVIGMGVRRGGAARWLTVGPILIQPAEMAKLALVVWLAYSLAKKADKVRSFTVGFIPHVLMAGGLILLCLKQPDFGSAVVIAFLTFALLFVAGARMAYLFGGLIAVIAIGVQLVMSQGYRMARLTAYLDIAKHRQGSAYQPLQSVMSFGSGEITGLGLGKGLPVLYLPEAHNVFIAAILSLIHI